MPATRQTTAVAAPLSARPATPAFSAGRKLQVPCESYGGQKGQVAGALFVGNAAARMVLTSDAMKKYEERECGHGKTIQRFYPQVYPHNTEMKRNSSESQWTQNRITI